MVPSCAEGGVLGDLPGIIGSLQALEAIKLILGTGEPLVGRLLLLDAMTLQWRTLNVRKNPACPACGDHPTITKLIDYLEFCGVAGYEEATPEDEGVPLITAGELNERLERGDRIRLVDVRQPHEWEIVNLGARGAELIPLAELMERVSELDTTEEIVLYCQTGARSAKALRQLEAAGFRRLTNLRGGIRAWHTEVDPDIPVY
jgi:adenylyltransferase/sulfurtransferase